MGIVGKVGSGSGCDGSVLGATGGQVGIGGSWEGFWLFELSMGRSFLCKVY